MLSEAVKSDDLVNFGELYHKNKFANVPFSGKVTGQSQRSLKNGKLEGLWKNFHGNGQLRNKEHYRDVNQAGIWEYYFKNG